MKTTTLLLVLGWTSAALLLVSVPGAQAQTHTPGTKCFTPQGWCWAQVRGPVGGACACPTPGGWVRGTLG